MSHKIHVVNTGRDIYFNTSGRDTLSGKSVENAVSDPTRAIAIINAFATAPTASNPASIVASETGAYNTAITTPNFTTCSCRFASITIFGGTNITSGERQSSIWGAIVNLGTDGVCIDINGKTRLAFEVNAMAVGLDSGAGQGTTGNIGFKVRGTNDDIFIQLRQMEIRGDAAIGIEHTAVTGTPTNYRFDTAEFFNRNQTFFKMNSSDPLEEVDLTLGSVSEGSPVGTFASTSSLAFDVISGVVNVTALTVAADTIATVGAAGRFGIRSNVCSGDMTVESGGNALTVAQLWLGDITVDSGGTLHAVINDHVGTVTNNGTIHGRINGQCYGNWCEYYDDVSANNEISKTSTSFALAPEALQKSFVVPFDGTYTIGAMYQFRHEKKDNQFRSQIRIDGVEETDLRVRQYSGGDDSETDHREPVYIYMEKVLTAGTYDIDLQFSSDEAGTTVYMFARRLFVEGRNISDG